MEVGGKVNAFGVFSHEANAFGGQIDSDTNDGFGLVGAEMDALDAVVAKALLRVDEVRAQVFAQRCATTVDGCGKALVNKPCNALAAKAVGVDQVRGCNAISSNTVSCTGREWEYSLINRV